MRYTFVGTQATGTSATTTSINPEQAQVDINLAINRDSSPDSNEGTAAPTPRDLGIDGLIDMDRVNASKEVMQYIKEMIELGTPTRETLEAEQERLANRYISASDSLLSATLLASAGIQGANQLMAQAQEEIGKINYFMGLISDSPKEYAMAKAADLSGKFSPYLQSIAQNIAMMDKGIANAYAAYAQLKAVNLNEVVTLAQTEGSDIIAQMYARINQLKELRKQAPRKYRRKFDAAIRQTMDTFMSSM